MYVLCVSSAFITHSNITCAREFVCRLWLSLAKLLNSVCIFQNTFIQLRIKVLVPCFPVREFAVLSTFRTGPINSRSFDFISVQFGSFRFVRFERAFKSRSHRIRRRNATQSNARCRAATHVDASRRRAAPLQSNALSKSAAFTSGPAWCGKTTPTTIWSFIDRVKWRHISMVAIRSPFCRSTPSHCA